MICSELFLNSVLRRTLKSSFTESYFVDYSPLQYLQKQFIFRHSFSQVLRFFVCCFSVRFVFVSQLFVVCTSTLIFSFQLMYFIPFVCNTIVRFRGRPHILAFIIHIIKSMFIFFPPLSNVDYCERILRGTDIHSFISLLMFAIQTINICSFCTMWTQFLVHLHIFTHKEIQALPLDFSSKQFSIFIAKNYIFLNLNVLSYN